MAGVGQKCRQGALPQGGVRVGIAHFGEQRSADIDAPGADAAARLGLSGQRFHGGKVVDVQKLHAAQARAVGGAPQRQRRDAAPALRVEAGQPSAHAVAHQRCAARAVGLLHVGDGALDVVGHVGQRVGRERLGAVAAAGKIQPHRRNALGGQIGGQRRKVAVAAAAAGKAVAEHDERQFLPAGQLAGQLYRGVNVPARAGYGDVLRFRCGRQQKKRCRHAERQRGNAACKGIKSAFMRLFVHRITSVMPLLKPMRGKKSRRTEYTQKNR